MSDCVTCSHPKDDHLNVRAGKEDEPPFLGACWNKDAPPMEFYCECQQYEPKEERK